jgi:hypothetical protein
MRVITSSTAAITGGIYLQGKDRFSGTGKKSEDREGNPESSENKGRVEKVRGGRDFQLR